MSILDTEYTQILKESGALKEGHFILSSGLHSQYYVQCALIMSNPYFAKKICTNLVNKIKETIDITQINKIISPAMGGILVGYEIARQLEISNIFLERIDKKFTLRRGFNIEKEDKILVIEDVLTTGKSSLETYDLINNYEANIVAEACIIRRNPDIKQLNNVPIIPLIDLDFPTYTDDNIPSFLKDTPIEKPGSRFIKK